MAHIWHADERIAWPTERRGAADESCDPAAELARFGRLKTLRSLLQRLVTQHGGQGASAPPLAFERWLARAALRRAAEADPVLPAADGVDTQLVADLSRSLPREKAVIIAEALSARSRDDAARQAAVFSDAAVEPVPEAAARRLVKSVRRAGKPLPTDAAAWAALATAAEALAAHARSRAEVRPAYTIAVNRDGPNVRLAAMDGDAPKKPYVLISHDHYAKLTTLHARYGTGDPDERIFCVVTRYEALRGAGFQCAVPGACFESLREFLGNTIECFASPLNCRFERYFSAFPGLESSFGSLGSFFDEWHRIEAGSFEVNPPFVPEVLAFAAAKIGELLGDGAKGALSFLAVVPDWGGGSSAAQALRESPFLRANVTIPAAEHVFVDGAQHRVRDRHRPSSWDTAVLLLQNSAGCAKWPLDTKTLARVARASFRRAATEAAPEGAEDLQAWEKRGPGRGGKKRPRSAPPKRKM
jgi:phosphorylated CTD-interacting factor 1